MKIAALLISSFLLVFASPSQAATPDVTMQVTASIHAELQRVRGKLDLPTPKAVALLDSMLVQQYLSPARLANEPDGVLKPGYYEAATLLMNGYPVAGGTLVSTLRELPAWQRSASAPALGAFVDAMLSPTGEEDADLVAFQAKATAVTQGIRDLPFAVRFPAQVWLVGEVYGDGIATAAGKSVLEATHPTPAQRQVIEAARQASAAIPVPSIDDEGIGF